MKRRSFLGIGASLAAIPLFPAAAEACGGKKGAAAAATPIAAPAQAAACGERIVARVGQNHGHVFVVSAADVTAGVDRTYDLTGTAGHGHSVTLVAEHWTRLRGGENVRISSTREGHQHRLLIKCAPAVDPPEATNVCQIEIGGKDDHELIITEADVRARVEKSYEMQGIAIHSHAVKLTAADFEKLTRGEQLNITSGPGDGHSHVIYLRYPLKTKTG
ncbi:MAG: hypothetical protein ABJE95_38760 [Byssovorax sp.]